MSKLFTPLKLGHVTLNQRIAMAPLTRQRASDDHVPAIPLAKEYYEQRASVPGTLIISEGTIISYRAGSFKNAPGIWNDEQVEAWKQITSAVHAKGSFIFCQLWAHGRAATPDLHEARHLKRVSSSATQLEGYPVPEAMTEEEIQLFIGDYVHAAQNAMKAGFDGVELHGANGYLIDQFTQDVVNKRTDRWGGSVENRSRFGVEVATAVAAAVGAKRTAFRISPFSDWQGMRMADPHPQFSDLVTKLKALDLAYLHVVESRVSGIEDGVGTESIDFLAKIWGKTGALLLAGGFKPDNALNAIEEFPDNDVVIVFGRYFIANPDLVFKIKKHIPLAKYDRSTFYTHDAHGYTDVPFSKEFLATQA